ncbi:hypothetical protein Nm8I071_24620 [Nonomuraea sp. TT08I-71]|nr:hypothetical protein Nm8I071_24620 [Nonomuraea sp. TT08I-71]
MASMVVVAPSAATTVGRPGSLAGAVSAAAGVVRSPSRTTPAAPVTADRRRGLEEGMRLIVCPLVRTSQGFDSVTKPDAEREIRAGT